MAQCRVRGQKSVGDQIADTTTPCCSGTNSSSTDTSNSTTMPTPLNKEAVLWRHEPVSPQPPHSPTTMVVPRSQGELDRVGTLTIPETHGAITNLPSPHCSPGGTISLSKRKQICTIAPSAGKQRRLLSC